jgi:RNA polymerase sigma-70 factor (ECF subfamily)
MTLEEAFDQYHQGIFGFVWRLTRRADVAEDITQECFLALIKAPARFDDSRASFKTYLFAIARNLARKQYRDSRPESPLDDSFSAPLDGDRLDIARAVERAVADLPPLQQEALLLFEYEGFTLEEIAAVAGADASAVKSRLHRARERLKRTLAPYRKAGNLDARPR